MHAATVLTEFKPFVIGITVIAAVSLCLLTYWKTSGRLSRAEIKRRTKTLHLAMVCAGTAWAWFCFLR